MRTSEYLDNVASERLRKIAFGAKYLKVPKQIVVFGSMSSGLQRSDSDIDVLCVDKKDLTVKTDFLDLIVISEETLRSERWLQSELASHIAEYGTWIVGSTGWRSQVHIGEQAIQAKKR